MINLSQKINLHHSPPKSSNKIPSEPNNLPKKSEEVLKEPKSKPLPQLENKPSTVKEPSNLPGIEEKKPSELTKPLKKGKIIYRSEKITLLHTVNKQNDLIDRPNHGGLIASQDLLGEQAKKFEKAFKEVS